MVRCVQPERAFQFSFVPFHIACVSLCVLKRKTFTILHPMILLTQMWYCVYLLCKHAQNTQNIQLILNFVRHVLISINDAFNIFKVPIQCNILVLTEQFALSTLADKNTVVFIKQCICIDETSVNGIFLLGIGQSMDRSYAI